jgi:hypothetical protein
MPLRVVKCSATTNKSNDSERAGVTQAAVRRFPSHLQQPFAFGFKRCYTEAGELLGRLVRLDTQKDGEEQ